jgi:hypothetical protein
MVGRSVEDRRFQAVISAGVPPRLRTAAVPGHWEGDLIIGKNNANAIGTLVERTPGYTMLVHLPDGYKPEQVRDALTEKIKMIPDILRASLTWDQGREMRDWQQVSVAADIDVHFCDPHSPGNATPRRTPTGCCAITSRKAPTWPSTATMDRSDRVVSPMGLHVQRLVDRLGPASPDRQGIGGPQTARRSAPANSA